jgi:hypothetical protein
MCPSRGARDTTADLPAEAIVALDDSAPDHPALPFATIDGWVLVDLGILGGRRLTTGGQRTDWPRSTKCRITDRFPSLMRVIGHVSAADEGLLSADALEPPMPTRRATH